MVVVVVGGVGVGVGVGVVVVVVVVGVVWIRWGCWVEGRGYFKLVDLRESLISFRSKTLLKPPATPSVTNFELTAVGLHVLVVASGLKIALQPCPV